MEFKDVFGSGYIGNGIETAGEKSYRYLIENLPVAIYACDVQGYITLYNKAALNIWGRTPVLNVDRWSGCWKIYKTDGVTPVALDACPMAEVLKGLPVSQKEIIVERPDGGRFYIEPYPIATYNERGEITGAINMLTDITAQKAAQKKIEESQLLFKTVTNSAPVGLWITSTEGECTFVNQTWLSWTGASLEQALKEGWFRRVVEEDKQRIREDFRNAFNIREHFRGEFRLKRIDGEIRWCVTEGYPFNNTDGEFVGYAGSVTDITDRKIKLDELEKLIEERTRSLRKKNEELKSSEEKYYHMTEEVQDYSIILLDKEGTILNWTTGARKIKGYTEEEIVGKNFRIFYLQEDLESYLPEKLIAQAVETGRATNEGWRKRKDGSVFWGSIVITALHDNKDNVIGFSKVTRDLTERKMAEDTMKKYLIELERQNRELEQFAYVSSHDLQEPLRKIRTFSDLLESKVEDTDQKTYLKKINSSAERMSELIKDLLDYSRLNSEGLELVLVDLNTILENVKTDLEVLIDQKNAQIINDRLPVIGGIPIQFNQLFMNLLSNSLKFNTGQPIIKIQAKTAPLYEIVAAKLDTKRSYVKITFTDNGIGFEQEYSDRIFTIFQRLNTRQKFNGTGIGLAMCKKIVENHKGYIKASGRQDNGATFTIYLPVNDELFYKYR